MISEFVVLAEDLQGQVFACRALAAAGVESRKIRRVNLPIAAGGGAGDASVRARYAAQVKAIRKRQAKSALVVHIDADKLSVAQRHQQLADALKDAGLTARGPTEAIAELVPRRNVETWIYCLDPDLRATISGLNEEVPYPKLEHESSCAAASRAFAAHAKANTPPPIDPAIPSLDDGIQEFRRVLP